MTQAVAAAAMDPSALEGFLKYGPLGLAGLTFVLVVGALSFRKLDHATANLLRLVLFVGAFCFIAALFAEHFAVQPPPPAPDYSKQRAVLGNVEKALHNSEGKLEEIATMASDGGGCPGGGHGIPIPHGADMASRSADVLGTIRVTGGDLQAVIDSLPGR